MVERKELTLILVLIFIVLVLISISSFFKLDVEESDARRFVQEDLHAKYPAADTEILTTLEKKDEKGQKYFEIKVRITKAIDTPCPERFHTYYYYPKQNFVNPPDEVITKDCKICIENEKSCVIAFKEEAIIASHTLAGTEKIQDFIRNYPTATAIAFEATNAAWTVAWDTPESPYRYQVILKKTGEIVRIDELPALPKVK